MVKPPPKQTNYEEALERAFVAVRSRDAVALSMLGADESAPGCYRLPVLDTTFLVNLQSAEVTLATVEPPDNAVRIQWRILALHYLSAPPGEPSEHWVGFSELEPAAQIYQAVYEGRVLGRLCGIMGRDRGRFVEAALRLNGERTDLGDEGFRFRVFPKLPVQIAWYLGDDEFPPSASFVYPENATHFLSLEDVVVLSERVVGRLGGGSW